MTDKDISTDRHDVSDMTIEEQGGVTPIQTFPTSDFWPTFDPQNEGAWFILQGISGQGNELVKWSRPKIGWSRLLTQPEMSDISLRRGWERCPLKKGGRDAPLRRGSNAHLRRGEQRPLEEGKATPP